MVKRVALGFLPLAVLIALPILLRPSGQKQAAFADERIIILTPHNEAIRYEFGRAFTEHCRQRGRAVHIDWRSPGGTSEIVRFIDDQFVSAFRRQWISQGQEWTREVQQAFNNRKYKADTASETEALARTTFLNSEVGIGIDLFFGGGEYYFRQQAEKGHAVDAGLQTRQPTWFQDDIIPARFSGETFYDPQGRYYGTCLSAFGICYNPERLPLLPAPPPASWEDLGSPVYLRQLGVADPTKSGSITKCFEMIIQQKMAEELALPQPETAASDALRAACLSAGWDAGLNLIKRIGGNARYITDSAGKIPRDVSNGSAAAGMCIDFYGRSQADWSEYQGGTARIAYITPRGGSSISVDPIQLLRGAPNRELAVLFIEFVLSPEGQRIWNYRVGEPGGPAKYALRRLPIRKDLYTDEDRKHMSDGDQTPFVDAAEFEYDGRLTGPYFGLIRTLVKIMIIDSREQLIDCWEAIGRTGGPDRQEQATMQAFNALPFTYAEAAEAAHVLRNGTPEEVLQQHRAWGAFFRANFAAARQMALEQEAFGSRN